MAEIISTTLSWNQEDAQKYFLEPLFIGNDDLSMFDVMTNIDGAEIRLDRFSALEKFTLAQGAGGFNEGTAASVSNYTQVRLRLSRMEAEAYASAFTFYNTVKSQLLKKGVERGNMDGTLLQEIVSEIFLKGLKRDLKRQVWLGDLASSSVNYDSYNGIFKEMAIGLPAAQKLTIAAGALGTDVALDTMKLMYDAAPAELLEMADDAVYFVSRSFADNYRSTLQNATNNVASYEALLNGAQLSYNGITIMVNPEWDVHITADSLATDTGRAVLTVKDNVVVGTDFQAQDVDMWYNVDEKQNRFRMNYSIGVALRDGKLSVTALQA